MRLGGDAPNFVISSSKSPTGLPIVPVVLTHALLDDATNLAERLSVLDSN